MVVVSSAQEVKPHSKLAGFALVHVGVPIRALCCIYVRDLIKMGVALIKILNIAIST